MVMLASVLVLLVYSWLPKPVEVKTARVARGVLDLELSCTGIVESKLSDISPRITARIIKFYTEEGRIVRADEPLVQLENSDLIAEVERQEAAVRAAKDEVASLERTAAAESGSLASSVERARATLKAARERLRELEAGTREEDIAGQRALVAQALVAMKDAKAKYERAEELLQGGAISAQDRDTAKTSYEAAKAAVEAQQQLLRKLEVGARPETIAAARAEVKAAEASLREAEASLDFAQARKREVAATRAKLAAAIAALENARAQLAYATLRSPIRGVVVRKHKDLGEMTNPFEPVLTVAGLDKVWITAEVDEQDAAAIALGQRVRISVDAYPGRFVTGVVVRVSEIAEPKEVGRVRAKIVRAKIEPLEMQFPLRPGMEVNINGSLPAGGPTLLVPNDAIFRSGAEDSVYVIREGRAYRRRVVTGQSNFDFTQVLSGLRSGESVAVTSLDKLSDRLRVRVMN
jgi:HlyD family secretion protein